MAQHLTTILPLLIYPTKTIGFAGIETRAYQRREGTFRRRYSAIVYRIRTRLYRYYDHEESIVDNPKIDVSEYPNTKHHRE